MRKKLQNAYEQLTYEAAVRELKKCRNEFKEINQSAVKSLDEGFEETLTLHRLGLFDVLGISLKTTNCIESINSQLNRLLGRITYWKNSDQRRRWLAAALLSIKPNSTYPPPKTTVSVQAIARTDNNESKLPGVINRMSHVQTNREKHQPYT